jgi:hypothetical protein
MGNFKFIGRVLPPVEDFTLVGTVSAKWVNEISPSLKQEVETSLSITKSVVCVDCESNLFGTDDYDGHVDLYANDLARAVVNSYAFAKGLGLSVLLETVVKPDGIKYNIRNTRPELEPLVTAMHSSADGGVDIHEVFPIVLKDPTISVALNDLISSLTQGQEAPVKCGRAVDAIRHSMAPANDRAKGWQAMRENLNLTEDYLKFVTEQSKGPRHGNVLGTTWVDGHEAVKRSWIVMNRFLEFKKRGNQRLPVVEFPLL